MLWSHEWTRVHKAQVNRDFKAKEKFNKMEIQGGRISGNQVHTKKINRERCYEKRKLIRGLLQQQRRTCSLKSFYDCLVKAYVYCKTPRLSRALANPIFLKQGILPVQQGGSGT